MAQVETSTQYIIRLAQDEFRLVGLALAGKLKGKDIHAAAALNEQLLKQRASHLKDVAEVATYTLKKAVVEREVASHARAEEVQG